MSTDASKSVQICQLKWMNHLNDSFIIEWLWKFNHMLFLKINWFKVLKTSYLSNKRWSIIAKVFCCNFFCKCEKNPIAVNFKWRKMAPLSPIIYKFPPSFIKNDVKKVDLRQKRKRYASTTNIKNDQISVKLTIIMPEFCIQT